MGDIYSIGSEKGANDCITMENILVTICARGGSKGVKGKNIRNLAGNPLIYYTIKQALAWGKAKHVITTTDSEEIAQIAKSCGSEVPFMRPAELATDTCGTLPVLHHALAAAEAFYKEKYDIVMDLPVTAPVRTVEDLAGAFKLFKEKTPKTLISVVNAHRNPYFNMLEETSNGRVNYSKPNSNFLRRQDAPSVYDMNNAIYIYQSDYLRDPENMKAISSDTIAFVMDDLSAIDIDTEVDFKILESLVKELIIKI